jgi:monofunctional glycosyltransferase
MIRLIFKIIFKIIRIFFLSSVIIVFIYKIIPPPVTPIMTGRVVEGLLDGEVTGIKKSWKDFDEISPNVFSAFVSAEDKRFLRHHGIDWKAVEQAKRYNEIYKGRKMRGASTITMQTAKNTFLSHNRNYLRKAFEVYFTYLIEAVWGKKRILEIYSNVIEFGNGIYGVEYASQYYFGRPAIELTRTQASLLAAVLPNPHRWTPSKPTPYLSKRAYSIRSGMGRIRIED